MQKVIIFESMSQYGLTNDINKFAKTHFIEQICYTVSLPFYSCCILYREDEKTS